MRASLCYLFCIILLSSCQTSTTQHTSPTSTNNSIEEDGYTKTNLTGLDGWQKGSKTNSKEELEEDGTYFNGKREGAWNTYHTKNGLISSITHYKDGLKNGAFIQMNDRATVELVAYYINDKLEGPYRKFNRSKIKEESLYKNGKLDGVRKQFYDDGSIQLESVYVNGKRNGVEKYYDQEGNVTIEYEYNNGTRVKK